METLYTTKAGLGRKLGVCARAVNTMINKKDVLEFQTSNGKDLFIYKDDLIKYILNNL